MTCDGRADHLLAYFRSDVLAAYHAQPDKFSVSTDHFEGRVETTGAYFEVLDAAGRTDESIGVLFGYRTLASGELAVVVWGPDLFDKSAWHVQQWSAFRIDGRAVDWMPVADDTRFTLWTRRHLSGDWNVENGPGAALAEVIALINELTLEIVGSRLFDVDDPRISFPAAENTHRYADAHRELYGVIADGLDKATIQAIASALGRAVSCASDRTLICLRKALPALDEEAEFSTPLATMSAQRRLAAHKERPAAQPMRAFDVFTEDLRSCVGAIEKVRTTLKMAFGVDATKCRTRQDALRHLRRFEDETLPANCGMHAASGMIGKTVESVRVGEREHTPGIHRSEMIEIHFTDGS